MKATPDLYNLIHFLSKNEKRYVSVFLKKSRITDHYRLFKKIEKQNQFTESGISTFLKKEEKSRYLPNVKRNLYTNILKCLSQYNYGKSKDIYFHQSLVEIELLFNKNLFLQANKKLEKIRKLAENREAFKVLLQISIWERRLLKTSSMTQVALDRLMQNESSLIRKIEEENNYIALEDEILFFVHETGEIRQKLHEKRIRNFLKHKLLLNSKDILCDISKIKFFNIRANCYNFLGENAEALKNVVRYIDLLRRGIDQHRYSPVNYVLALNNKALIQIHLSTYSDALLTIKEMNRASSELKPNENQAESIFNLAVAASYKLELYLYIKSRQYEKALKFIPSIEIILNKSTVVFGDESIVEFYYYFSYVYFIFKYYKKTLFYLNKIIFYKKGSFNSREDILCYSRILLVLTHYEMGKENLSLQLVQSTFNYVFERKRLYKIENKFLGFVLNKLLKKALDPAELKSEFIQIKGMISRLTKNVYERKVLDHFDFISWIESKISKRSFIEVLSENHKSSV